MLKFDAKKAKGNDNGVDIIATLNEISLLLKTGNIINDNYSGLMVSYSANHYIDWIYLKNQLIHTTKSLSRLRN